MKIRNYYKLTFIVVTSIFYYSCDNTDPLPMSVANFKITSVSPEVDIPVQFENLSINTAAIAWDFGDGTKDSLKLDPVHTYTEPDTYQVKMTAYTEDGQKSESIQDVTVGERYLEGMWIFNIPMTDPDGNPWDDDGSGPDILFQLIPNDAETLDDVAYVFFDSVNVGLFKVPVGITTDNLVPENFLLANKDYFLLLDEVDTVENEAVFTPMVELAINPVKPEDGEYIFINETKFGDGFGELAIPGLVIQEYQFVIDFEIK